MALTPLDIHNREFKRVFRGYEEEEVDNFIKQVLAEYEKLFKENIDLKEALKKKDGSITEYKDLEETIKNALVLAQQTAEEVTRNAHQKAENIITEAEQKAKSIVDEAGKNVDSVVKNYEDMKQQARSFRVRFQSFLESQLAIIKEEERSAGEDKKEAGNVEITSVRMQEAPKKAQKTTIPPQNTTAAPELTQKEEDKPLIELGKLVEVQGEG